jgi:hypothetical protein
MFKKISHLWLIMLTVLFLSACVGKKVDAEQAQNALSSFFAELNAGRYDAVPHWYAGSYETLIEFNPEVNPDDQASLWQNGCQINGLQCLTVRTATFNELSSKGEFIFTVEFNTQDSNLFVLEACCGENPTNPPQFQFEYRVVKGSDGVFRVLDMPVYLP